MLEPNDLADRKALRMLPTNSGFENNFGLKAGQKDLQ
jgi:hypothetical protein